MNTARTPLEERLTAAAAAATPEVDVDALLRRIDERRTEHRRAAARQRRSRRVLASGALVAATVASVVLITTRSTQDLRTVGAADPAAPSVVSRPQDDVTAPVGDDPERDLIDLPGAGSRATAVAADAEGFWVSRGEALDGDRSGPDTVTWIGHDGTVGPSTQVLGVALSGVADADRLWFLVREADDPTAPGALRLKQVERSSGTLLASHDVPLGEPPTGISLDGTSVRVHGTTRDVVLDRSGAVIEDGAPPRGPVPARVFAPEAELAGVELDPSEAVVSADDEQLWILSGTTVRAVPRDR